MISFRQYFRPETLEEAYALNQKKANRVVGGMLWLKQSKNRVGGVIDLSGLGLQYIKEEAAYYEIGAMTTLRELEHSTVLPEAMRRVFCKAFGNIVGVQFQNMATVGGSVYGRFGFSDVVTVLLAMDAQVVLHHAGCMSLEAYTKLPYDRDLLVAVRVPKHLAAVSYEAVRNNATDFPVLNVAAAKIGEVYRVAIGARPAKACLFTEPAKACLTKESAEAIGEAIGKRVVTGSNPRGTAAYRTKLAKVLTKRALLGLLAEEAQLPVVAKAAGELVATEEPAAEKPAVPGKKAPVANAKGLLQLQFTLNGEKVETEAAPDAVLLDVLRRLGCFSVKRGCETSNCGLCTVFFDGKPILSCSILAARANGSVIETLEGLQEEAREFGEYIADQGADQCGFCNPGFVMNTLALLREKPDPTEEEILAYLAGNLCRCSGYVGQLRGIQGFLAEKKKKAQAKEEQL